MKPLTLEEVIQAMDGSLDRAIPGGSVKRVTTDSRDVEPGDLFVAIRGERFDGHDFVGEVFAKGAMAAVVHNDYKLPQPTARAMNTALPTDAMLIRVPDSVLALGKLGQYHRRSAMGGSMTVIAVTGSNGKTTTKAMIAHILNGRWPGKASVKSFNNEIGVPITLLTPEQGDTFLICEVGTNAPGEIATLGALIEPDIAVVTCVGPAHLERLGSIEGIAIEKLSLLNHLKPDGCAFVNIDHETLRNTWQNDRSLMDTKVVTFGSDKNADLRLTSLETNDDGMGLKFRLNDRFDYALNVAGRHNAFNALAAIGVARRMGMRDDEIAERLATFELPPMRLQVERFCELTVINDAYNANPASFAAALDVLTDTPGKGRRVAIVGDMRELGATAVEHHEQAARRIAASNVDMVIAVGEHARHVVATIRETSNETIETHAYASTALAKRRLTSHLRPDDTVLVKGSRLMALEQLIETMRRWTSATEPDPTGTQTPAHRRVSA